MAFTWLALLLTMAMPLGGGASAHAPSSVHPSDGPDVDVRILVGESRATVTLVLNLAFVDEIVDAPREDERVVHEVELPGIGATLVDHFKEALTVEVDGVPVTPFQRRGVCARRAPSVSATTRSARCELPS